MEQVPFNLGIPEGSVKPLQPSDFVISIRDTTRVLVDQVSLTAADNVDGMDPDMIGMAKAMKTPLLRFGGNFTSAYNWRDGIGPRDKRIAMLNLACGMPEYNQFGTDEFLDFCRLIGAQPQIALNLGTGTPQGAADWVRYVNQLWNTHSGLTRELGNELWGSFQVGYPPRDHLGKLTKSFSDAVHAVDPNARLIATGADPDKFHDWNAVQLENPVGTFNDLSTHFVVTTVFRSSCVCLARTIGAPVTRHARPNCRNRRQRRKDRLHRVALLGARRELSSIPQHGCRCRC